MIVRFFQRIHNLDFALLFNFIISLLIDLLSLLLITVSYIYNNKL